VVLVGGEVPALASTPDLTARTRLARAVAALLAGRARGAASAAVVRALLCVDACARAVGEPSTRGGAAPFGADLARCAHIGAAAAMRGVRVEIDTHHAAEVGAAEAVALAGAAVAHLPGGADRTACPAVGGVARETGAAPAARVRGVTGARLTRAVNASFCRSARCVAATAVR
jgi:hypothetical protein